MFHSQVLANGLRVIIVEQLESPIISAGIFIRQGSRNENELDNGISHFLEHLIFNNYRAIKRKKKLVEELSNNGGILSAFTTKECTSFEGIALNQHAQLLLQTLFDLIFEPNFNYEDVNAERLVILAELSRKLHSSDQIMDYLAQCIYGDISYGKRILGTEEFISHVKFENLHNYYKKAYVADNVAMVIMTSLNVSDIFKIVQELFENIPSGIPNPKEVEIVEQVQLKVLKQKSNQILVCLGGVGPSLRDDESAIFEVASTAWGESPNSRLSISAREQHGLVYHIQSFYRGYVQTGQWGIFASVTKENFGKLMKVISEEIHRFHTEPLKEDEIKRAISNMKTHLYCLMQRPEDYLRILGRRAVFREVIYPNELIRQYELATQDSIQSVVQKYINLESMSMVVMGDIDSDTVLETLSRMGDI